MNLLQVRKGQFVFYENEIHKVYTVKPLLKNPVHLYRLRDMKQVLTKAKDISYYKPKHNDTFIFYGKRYTIDEKEIPKPGDYILITKPAPDFLDHYSLNEIEKIDSVDNGNVVTTRDNGVKHHEYVVLVPGRKEGSQEIAYYDKTLVPESKQIEDESMQYLAEQEDALKPLVGDIYYDNLQKTKAMIVAMTEDEVVFGHGTRVHFAELLDENNYRLVYRFDDEL